MSSSSAYPPDRPPPETAELPAEEGHAWIVFAGLMLLIVGALNTIYGIAAVGKANFYVDNVNYVFGDLETWGWILLVVGALQLVAAFSVWSGGWYGRWFGVATAALNGIAQLLFIPSYPLLSVTLFAVDVLIIYGLIAHGGRQRA
jgi:uncharacterized membrane protein HdeD (DUF308 family)